MICLLTTYDTLETMVDGLRASAAGYLLKDCSAEELCSAVRTVARGQVVRVWRNHNTGAVYQCGGWSYVMVLVGLMVARVIIYIVLRYSGIVAGFGPINFAFIALALGNYLGRSINVHLRSQRLMLQVA